MANTEVDKGILDGGMHAPIVHGDFRLYEVSIESPSTPGALLHLNKKSTPFYYAV